jgi:3-dehydroquinate synthase
LPDGEENKTLEVLTLILDKALECALDRKVTFVALGGGVIGDMVGFAAVQIYQRGVNFIQVSGCLSTCVHQALRSRQWPR